MKGVIITSGFGKRMWPITDVYPKIFHVIYDKPSIYYNLSHLIDMGIRDICIVGTPTTNKLLKELLYKENLGICLSFIDEDSSIVQGTATSVLRAEKFVGDAPFALFLGDSLFIDMSNNIFKKVKKDYEGNPKSLTITTPVTDARAYAYFNNGYAVEKGTDKYKHEAIPGFYIFSPIVFKYLKLVKKSIRGEFELVSAVNEMIRDGLFQSMGLKASIIWIDTGAVDKLEDASALVELIQKITGNLVGSPQVEAFKKGWIQKEEMIEYLNDKKSSYSEKVKEVIERGQIKKGCKHV